MRCGQLRLASRVRATENTEMRVSALFLATPPPPPSSTRERSSQYDEERCARFGNRTGRFDHDEVALLAGVFELVKSDSSPVVGTQIRKRRAAKRCEFGARFAPGNRKRSIRTTAVEMGEAGMKAVTLGRDRIGVVEVESVAVPVNAGVVRDVFVEVDPQAEVVTRRWIDFFERDVDRTKAGKEFIDRQGAFDLTGGVTREYRIRYLGVIVHDSPASISVGIFEVERHRSGARAVRRNCDKKGDDGRQQQASYDEWSFHEGLTLG
jgi:hypothetical protein